MSKSNKFFQFIKKHSDTCLLIFYLAALFFILHCHNQISKSLSNSRQLATEIRQDLKTLGNELQTLRQTRGVDYE